MFDVWLGDIELTTLTLIVSAVVILPLQVLLCRKVKSLSVRLTPVAFFTFAASVLVLTGLNATGWNSIGYFLLAIFAAIMLFACVMGWAVWFLLSRIRKR